MCRACGLVKLASRSWGSLSHNWRSRDDWCVLNGLGVWLRYGGLGHDGSIAVDGRNATSLDLRAVAADVACLTATVTGLARSIQWSTVGSLAVTRDVAKLAACVALHSLRLAVACEVVGTTALVAGRSTVATSEASTEAAKASTGSTSTATGWWTCGSGARCRAVPLLRCQLLIPVSSRAV